MAKRTKNQTENNDRSESYRDNIFRKAGKGGEGRDCGIGEQMVSPSFAGLYFLLVFRRAGGRA